MTPNSGSTVIANTAVTGGEIPVHAMPMPGAAHPLIDREITMRQAVALSGIAKPRPTAPAPRSSGPRRWFQRHEVAAPS